MTASCGSITSGSFPPAESLPMTCNQTLRRVGVRLQFDIVEPSVTHRIKITHLQHQVLPHEFLPFTVFGTLGRNRWIRIGWHLLNLNHDCVSFCWRSCSSSFCFARKAYFFLWAVLCRSLVVIDVDVFKVANSFLIRRRIAVSDRQTRTLYITWQPECSQLQVEPKLQQTWAHNYR